MRIDLADVSGCPCLAARRIARQLTRTHDRAPEPARARGISWPVGEAAQSVAGWPESRPALPGSTPRAIRERLPLLLGAPQQEMCQRVDVLGGDVGVVRLVQFGVELHRRVTAFLPAVLIIVGER